MAFNPCPCWSSLQKGSINLAIIDVILCVINVAGMIYAVFEYINHDAKDPDLSDTERTVGLVTSILLAVFSAFQILLALRLYNGAKNREYRNCLIWLIITIISTSLNIISLIVNLAASEYNKVSLGGALVLIFYKPYETLVVYCFLKELKKERDVPQV